MAKHYKINKKKFTRFIIIALVVLLLVVFVLVKIVKAIKNRPDPTPADQTRPVVTLEGQKKIYIVKGGKFSEPGYSAIDETDGDLTASVEIKWNPEFDSNTPGKYEIRYIATDAAGNQGSDFRTITVVKDASELQSEAFTDDMLAFDLNKYYSDVLCKETAFDEDKYKDVMFFGDSFVQYLGYQGYVSAYQYWSCPSTSTDDFYTKPMNYFKDGWNQDKTFYELMDENHPKYVIVLLNSDWTGRWTPEYLYESCNKAYADITSKYPDTTFVICSIMPVEDYYDIEYVEAGKADFKRNDHINKMNAYMCELCRQYDLKFLNAAEAVKNPNTGACYDEYIFLEDGVHLSTDGCEKMIEYIKNHLDF